MQEINKSLNQEIVLKEPLNDIKIKAVRGGAFSLIARSLSVSTHFVSVVVLARLLSPDDFGLYAMATVITGIFFVFQDVGLTDATIQADHVEHNVLSTLFWINSGIGLFVAVIICSLSTFAALFFKRKELINILLALSVQFIILGLSFQHLALLKRQFLFKQVSIIGIASSFSGAAFAIFTAALGMKYWSLVFRDIISALLTLLLTYKFSKWRPGRPKKSSEVFKLIRFGINSVGYYLINYISSYSDKAIIGKFFGSESLGFYSRAYYIGTTPSVTLNQSLFHVAISTLSKLRNNKTIFHRYYFKALSFLSFIGMPLSMFIVIMNKEIIYLLLGPKWAPTSILFSILGLSSGINIIYQTNNWLHVSLGRADRLLYWGILSSLFSIFSLFIGILFGINGIAWAYSISIFILFIPSILYAGKPISISLSLVIRAILKNIIAAVISGLLLWIIKLNFFDLFKIFPKIIACLLIYIVSYLACLIILHKRVNILEDYYKQIKESFHIS